MSWLIVTKYFLTLLFCQIDLLKHDKLLSSKAIPAHLKEIPEYLVDPTTKEASQIVKLTRAAMGIDNGPKKKHRPGFRKGSGKTSDPLRTFSAEVLFNSGNLQYS